MENDRRLLLPRYRNVEMLRPREMIGNRPVCEYFVRLLSQELRNEEYSRVVRGGIQTRPAVSERGIQPESRFIYGVLHVAVDDMLGNTAPYGEAGFKRSMQDTNAKLLGPSAAAL